MANKRYGMVIDARRCIGCHACTVACKAENDVPLGGWRTQVRYYEKGIYPHVRKYFLPILCNHSGFCVKASKKEGGEAFIRREDGIVVMDKAKMKKDANGKVEAAAVEACPFSQIYVNKQTGLPDKCTFCAHRVDQGLLPACVQTCLGRARVFGDFNDPNSEVSQLIARNPVTGLKEEEDKDPAVVYIGLDKDETHGPGGIKGFQPADEKDLASGRHSQQ